MPPDPSVGEEKVCFGLNIGNTSSAVSFAHFAEDEEPRVCLVTRWPGQHDAAGDCKVPTAVSYNPQGRAVHFGAEAVNNEGLNDTTLAKGFKLHLHSSTTRANIKLKPPPLPSGVTIKKVFTDFLKYLFEHAQSFVSISSAIDWDRLKNNFVVVMAIPNDWDEAQQAFLRSTVVAAGILPADHESSRLQFISEMEASAHFALRYGGIDSGLREGSTFAVCDAGGTTVDTTLYTCTSAPPNFQLMGLISSQCIAAGSILIDEAARLFLQRKLSGSSKYGTPEVIQLMVREFERKTKRKFDGEQNKNVIKFGRAVDNDSSCDIITGRIILTRDEVKSIFDSPVTAITSSIDHIMERAGGFDSLLLVGGFAESPYLRAVLDDRLQTKGVKRINIDKPTKAAAAEGAVAWFAKRYMVSRETAGVTAIHDMSRVASRLVEELCMAHQHEDVVELALCNVEECLQVAQAEVAEAMRCGEQKAAEANSQLVKERFTARQRMATLNAALTDAKRRLQVAIADEVEAQRLNEQRVNNVTSQLVEEHHAACRHEKELTAALVPAQNKPEVLNKGHAERRMFEEREEADGQAVISLLDNFIETVNNFASFVVETLNEEEQTASFIFERLREFATTNRWASSLVSSFLASISRMQFDVERVALPFIQYITFSLLANRVFLKTASLAGDVSEDASPYFQDHQDCVTASTTREMRGRWDAMTFSALRAPENEIAHASDIVADISDVLWALLPPPGSNGTMPQRVVGGFEGRVTKIVLDAIKLQDTIQRFSMPYKYGIFLPQSNQSYSVSDVEVFTIGPDGTQTPSAATQAAPNSCAAQLPVTPGLRSRCVGDNSSHLDLVVKKASVVVIVSKLAPASFDTLAHKALSSPPAAPQATTTSLNPRVHKSGRTDIISNISNVNYNTPHGIINNNNYVEMHVVARDQLADDLDTIERWLEWPHHVPRAVHDAQPTDAGCMEGTRVQLLADTKSFITARESPRILWIVGMAGTGKTSMALTVCRMLYDDPTILLGGTFFCSSTVSAIERADARLIIPTLATLLVRVIPGCAVALATELRKDPDLAHKSIRDQVKHLLAKPLDSLGSSDRQIVFVIDALDQCSDQRQLVELVNALADFRSAVPVKFLLTSRPNSRIRKSRTWNSEHVALIELHKVDPGQVTADIRLYIQKSFEKLSDTATWYTGDDLDHLATLSGGLFVFSAVAVDYILERNSEERLQVVNTKISKSSIARARLDQIYSLVVTEALNTTVLEPAELERARRIVAAVVASRVPLSVKTFAELLKLSTRQVRDALEDLHAVVFVPEHDEDDELRTLHPTFIDFLLISAPEGIRISESDGHDTLALGCLELLNTDGLRFNIASCETSYEPNPKPKPGWISPSLGYSCLHWAHHIKLAFRRFDDLIYAILRRKFPFWLEVFSVIGELGLALELLHAAASVAQSAALARFLSDAVSFTMSSQEALEFSPAHIYISALPFAPKNSLIHKIFSPLFKIRSRVESFDIDSGVVDVAALSLNGRAVASLSGTGSVRAWNVEYAEMPSTTCGREEEVHSLAISVEGRLIATGSADKVVRLWDAGSGQLVIPPLSKHTGVVTVVAFSPDGTRLLSGSEDKTLCVWDVETGGLLLTLPTTSSVSCAAYSLDGRLIAAGYPSGTVQIVESTTGRLRLTFECPTRVRSLAFAPNETFIRAASGNGIFGVDLSTRLKLPTATGHTARVNAVAYSGDGRFIASGADDATVRLWNAKTGKPCGVALCGHVGPVLAVTFSPLDQFAVSAGSDGTIRSWDTGTAQPPGDQNGPKLSAVVETASYRDGWLFTASLHEERLLWVPSKHREQLENGGESHFIALHHIIAEAGEFPHGEHWTRCWRVGS